MTDADTLAERFSPVLAEIEHRSRIGEGLLDTELYRVYLATLWANAVREPARLGLEADRLEAFYDLLNDHGRDVLGGMEPVRDCFRYLLDSAGEKAMERLRIPAPHRRQLAHLGALMGIAPAVGSID